MKNIFEIYAMLLATMILVAGCNSMKIAEYEKWNNYMSREKESLRRENAAKEQQIKALKEEKTMFQYRSEILVVSTKWFSDKANESDANELDALLNQRASEGWELVTYDYMATSTQVKGAFIITFRQEIQ